MTDQIDLFLDSLVNAPLKDERATMEFPFFCLTKKGRTEPLEYNDGKVSIRIEPGPRGIATIWDKDILIYCASAINERLERGAPISSTVTIAAYDLLKVCQRGTGKRSYELLLDSLVRLRSTTILTNITSGDERERRGFGWIDSFKIVERVNSRGDTVMAGLEVVLADWMFRAIVKERRVLTIDRAYFKLTMGLERRLYELARKHCGRQKYWDIGLPRLHEKCGSENPQRNFKQDLKTIIGRDSLPQYKMELLFDGNGSFTKALKADGYTPPQRWGINDKIIVRFTPKPNAFMDILPPPPKHMSAEDEAALAEAVRDAEQL
jgi:plasmid replication initiation protein